MTLTDAQIRNLLAMEYQASPGPWTKADDAHGIRCPAQGYSITGVSIKGIILEENRDIIIAARNHLRELCEEVLRLRAASDHTRALCQEVLRLRVANDDLEQRNADLYEIAGQRFDFVEEQREAAKDGALRESDNGDGDPA